MGSKDIEVPDDGSADLAPTFRRPDEHGPHGEPIRVALGDDPHGAKPLARQDLAESGRIRPDR
ncbi:MAG: hypothetical protein ACYTGC_17475 [Planctomycetota bacterium]